MGIGREGFPVTIQVKKKSPHSDKNYKFDVYRPNMGTDVNAPYKEIKKALGHRFLDYPEVVYETSGSSITRPLGRRWRRSGTLPE